MFSSVAWRRPASNFSWKHQRIRCQISNCASHVICQNVGSSFEGLIMRMRLMLCVLGLIATACRDEADMRSPLAPGAGEAVVYEAGPHLVQCSPVAMTRTQSAAKLTSAGVEVRRSSCGHITDVAHPAVCGAPTGQILLHDIPEASVVAAQGAGFHPVDSLGEWSRASCPQYLHAIEVAQGSASCAGIRNRVLQIQDAAQPDVRWTLLDRAGSCADAGYEQVLFGGSGNTVLCSNADSIAGAVRHCAEASRAAMFDTILANLDRSDLGLGAEYGVAQVYPVN